MIYNKTGLILIIFFNLQCCRNTLAYTQIFSNTNAGGTNDDDHPKLYKALNFDLLFPTSFNSSESVIPATPGGIPSSTQPPLAAAVGQPFYPLQQSHEPTHTAEIADEKRQKATLFVTPATDTESNSLAAAAAASNEAGIYDTQGGMDSNNYSAQPLMLNDVYWQQQQQKQQLNEDNRRAEKEQQANVATGRAVDYHSSYPFGQLITPLIKNAPHPVYRPSASSTSYSSLPKAASTSLAAPANVAKLSYPQAGHQQKPPSQAEIDKMRGKGKIWDRFSPSEGVASHSFKLNGGPAPDYHNHAATYKTAGKITSASDVVTSYVTPSNLYAFPPNNVNYPAQAQNIKPAASPSSSANSYSWPASGLLTNSDFDKNAGSGNKSPYEYSEPVHEEYLPPANSVGSMGEDKPNNSNDDADNSMLDELVGVLPASAMEPANDSSNADTTGVMDDKDTSGVMAGSRPSQEDKNHDHDHDNSYDTEKEYATPPPGWLKAHPESIQDHPHIDHEFKKPDIELQHDDDYNHQPDIIFNHDHDQYHHSFSPYPSYPTYHDQYPEIIYDEHHHHHPHVHHHPPPPPTTTEAPPPEPPPEPRVKKYSYFYIGRKLWYIPLYFTVWFSFYVLWLILKSIARHKVNLPNHYVARRSVDNYDLSQRQQETINQLTVSILDKIDKFKAKLK